VKCLGGGWSSGDWRWKRRVMAVMEPRGVGEGKENEVCEVGGEVKMSVVPGDDWTLLSTSQYQA
jgi:hypothetical protein